MPFQIIKRGNQYLVITKGTDRVHGHFGNRVAAVKQLRALYANVPEARQSSKAPRKKPKK